MNTNILQNSTNFISALIIIVLGTIFFFTAKYYLPKHIFNSEKIEEKSTNFSLDSLMLKAIAITDSTTVIAVDTIAKPITKYSNFINVSDFNFNINHPKDSLGNAKLLNPIELKSYTGKVNLANFFEKLIALENEKRRTVNIAYYGDSVIDGDLIVQDFRQELQSRFGGNGIGFVSITSESALSRYSVKHHFSGGWKSHNFLNGAKPNDAYGVNGAVFYATDSLAQVRYTSSAIKHSYKLYKPTLYYGIGNENAKLSYTINKDTTVNVIALNGTQKLNKIRLGNKSLKQITLNFYEAQNVPIYGLRFDNNNGINVDNFSNRGNSGLPLSLLQQSLMRKFNAHKPYDLIILQYGANVLSAKAKDYDWYGSRMKKTVIHIKACFPNAEILILGIADKSTKIDTEIKTDTSVVKLLSIQQKFASDSESSFMSLFHLMGGVHSMPIWVAHKPRLATSDYTHFTPKGAKKVAQLITNQLLNDYKTYKESINDTLSYD